jgi:hypothetical protein
MDRGSESSAEAPEQPPERRLPQAADREGEDLRAPDPDAERIVTSAPLVNEDGEEYVISQQNVGRGAELGDGEFPEPDEPPTPQAPG